MSDIQNEIEETFLGKVDGIDFKTTNKLHNAGFDTLSDLKEKGWQEVAKIKSIGEKKIIIIYSEIGISLTEDEIIEYRKELEKEKVSTESTPKTKKSRTTIKPDAPDMTEEDLRKIAEEVGPDISEEVLKEKLKSGSGTTVTMTTGSRVFLKFELTSDAIEFITTLNEDPETFLRRIESTILNSSDILVPTGARAHVKLWINLLEKKVSGIRPKYSINTMNTPEQFREVLIPLIRVHINDVRDEVSSGRVLNAVNIIKEYEEKKLKPPVKSESIINTLILYKIYIDAAGSEWDADVTKGQLGTTKLDGKEFMRRMKDPASGGSPDFDEFTIKRAWSAFQSGNALLLAGMPGGGKTYFAKAVGNVMTDKVWDSLPFTRVNVNGGLEPQDLIGDWDYQAQILALNVAKLKIGNKSNLTKEEIDALRENIYTIDYFRFGSLALSMIQGVPILIDEVNRGSPDIQNTLLQAIDENEIIIPAIGRIKASPGFFVVCTINESDLGAGEMGAAFLRRVNYFLFDEPKDFTKWVKQEFPTIDDSLLSQMDAVRKAIKSKSTITGEMPPSAFSAWARELINIYGPSESLTREKIVLTLGTLLKNKADIDDVRSHMDDIIREAGIKS